MQFRNGLTMKRWNNVVALTSAIAFAGSSLVVPSALAEPGYAAQGAASDSTCENPLKQPIALVMDESANVAWSKGRYEPKLSYGSLAAFPKDKVVILLPDGQTLSEAEWAAISSKGWGTRFFSYLLLPAIAQEVIENYLERNTTPLFQSNLGNSGGSSDDSAQSQVRSIASDVCINLVDAVVERVRTYYQER
jgi:hypothetical protein